jgi:hypothetical protein
LLPPLDQCFSPHFPLSEGSKPGSKPVPYPTAQN